MLTCQLSGQIVSNPVITPCHHVFERANIETYITEQSDLCPVCKSHVTTQDLFELPIKPVESYPANLKQPSFLGLLGSLQNEWVAVQTELHELRTQLQTTRRELAEALYENDAAKRVIARLIEDKDLAIPAHLLQSEVAEKPKLAPNKQTSLASYFRMEAKRITNQNKSKEKQLCESSDQIFHAITQYNLSRLDPILNGESVLSCFDKYSRQQILIGSENGLVLGIQANSGIPTQFASFDAKVVSISSDNSYSRFIAADCNGNVKICDLTKPGEILAQTNLNKPTVGAFFHPAGGHVYICYQNGEIELFVLNESDPKHRKLDSLITFQADHDISMADLHCDGSYIFATNHASRNLSVYDISRHTMISNDFVMPSEITSFALPLNNSRFVAAGCDSCIRIYDISVGTDPVAEIPKRCRHLAFDPSGYILSVLSHDNNELILYHLDQTGIPKEEITKEVYDTTIEVHFSYNEDYIAMLGKNDCIDLIVP